MTETTTQTVDTTPALPTVPGNDQDVKDHKAAAARIDDLFAIATADPAQRDKLNQRAVDLAVRTLTFEVKRTKVDTEVHQFFDIPKMGKQGEGYRADINYTRDRRALLVVVARLLGVAAEAAFERYYYSGSRRRPVVVMAGAEQERNIALLLAGNLGDQMVADVRAMTFPPSTSPQGKTAQRHVATAKFVEQVDAQLRKALSKANATDTAAQRVAESAQRVEDQLVKIEKENERVKRLNRKSN